MGSVTRGQSGTMSFSWLMEGRGGGGCKWKPGDSVVKRMVDLGVPPGCWSGCDGSRPCTPVTGPVGTVDS